MWEINGYENGWALNYEDHELSRQKSPEEWWNAVFLAGDIVN